MADQFSRMYDVERIGGDQRTRLAEMLRAAGQNAPQGQMVSGWYVAPSWSQNLNTALSGALGTYMGARLDEERKQKTADILRELSQGKEVPQEPVMQNFNRIEGVAEGQTPFPNQPAQNELQRVMGRQPIQVEGQTPAPMIQPRPAQPQFKPLTEEEKIGKVMELAQYNPYAAQIWSAQDTARQARLTKAEERAMDRDFKREQLQAQLEGKRDMMQFAASLRQPTGGNEKWTYDAGSDTWVMPPNQQFPMGRSTPNVAKVGALKNLNYLADAFTVGGVDEKGNPVPALFETTPQGGFLGITGAVGGVTNYAAGKAFDNKVEQLSNELRKIHRIPGEGTLSDKEQAQYGIQLPKKTNPREVNEGIIRDMKIRGANAVLPTGVNPLQMNPAAPTGNYGAPPAGAVREKK